MTQKNVFYIKGVDFLWMDIIETLEKSEGWKPVIWEAPFRSPIEEARSRFPDTLFYAQAHARQGVPPEPFLRSDLAAFDAETLKALSPHEQAIYEMMSRWFLLGKDTLDLDTRRHFYYNFIRIWKTVLRDLKIDIIVSGSIPHRTYDYILYLLCQEMGIPYLMITTTSFDNMQYTISSITDRSRAIREAMEKKRERLPLSPDTMGYVQRVRNSYEVAMPSYYRARVEKAQNINIFRKLFDRLPETIQTYLKIVKHAAKGSLSNQVGKLKFSQDSSTNNNSVPTYINTLQLFLALNKVNRTIINAKRWYMNNSVKPDLTKPYIYFAANYQPERSTCPDAGLYHDLHLIVDILAKAIPEDWSVYYKEHPTTFRRPFRMDDIRSVRYYERLSRIPNCVFVDYKADPFELIDNSQATAIATSTTGFQAMLRGVPVMEFGDSWYSSCPGVLRIRTFDECKEAIARIQEGYKPDQDKVMQYIAAAETVCKDLRFRKDNDALYKMKQDDPLEYADNMKLQATLLTEEYQRLHSLANDQVATSR